MHQTEIPQPIPTETCLACDVCCRFPERDSFLSPFFTDPEMAEAKELTQGPPPFRSVLLSAGGQVIPVPSGRGFRCPFFQPETHLCRIYAQRPLDCRLYPYALMLDPSATGVWIGIDTKCPATRDSELMERLVTDAGKIWEAAMSPDLVTLAVANPRLIGPHQPDVLPLFRAEELTSALLSANRLVPWKASADAFPHSLAEPKAVISPAPAHSTRPLRLTDRALVERYLRKTKPRLATHTFAIQFMASDLLSLTWFEMEGFFCLWAFDSETLYMPLPPLGEGSFVRILPACFALMDRHNRSTTISRVEGLSLSSIPKDGLEGYQLRPGYPEYLYRRSDLVDLRGRAFHGKRSDCQVFAKQRGIRYQPYEPSDQEACLALFHRWQTHRMDRIDDSVGRKLLDDARSCHLRALREGESMGLTGRVLSVGNDPVAYTFGVPLDEETFVVALEATDPSYRGASAYIFREFSRELKDYRFINAMDDSGLPGLRHLKRSYHPWRLEPSFVLSRQ